MGKHLGMDLHDLFFFLSQQIKSACIWGHFLTIFNLLLKSESESDSRGRERGLMCTLPLREGERLKQALVHLDDDCMKDQNFNVFIGWGRAGGRAQGISCLIIGSRNTQGGKKVFESHILGMSTQK